MKKCPDSVFKDGVSQEELEVRETSGVARALHVELKLFGNDDGAGRAAVCHSAVIKS